MPTNGPMLPKQKQQLEEMAQAWDMLAQVRLRQLAMPRADQKPFRGSADCLLAA
jgi:hypothetical protein